MNDMLIPKIMTELSKAIDEKVLVDQLIEALNEWKETGQDYHTDLTLLFMKKHLKNKSFEEIEQELKFFNLAKKMNNGS